MRNSDPALSFVFVQRPNPDLNNIFAVQITGCNFQYGPNCSVSLDPASRLWCCFFSWRSVFTTSRCIELSNLQCLSSWNTVHSPQHSEVLHPYKIYSVYIVVTASQFVLHVVGEESFDMLSLQRNFCLDRTEHDWLPHHNMSPRSFVQGFVFFTHLCDCSGKTELVCRTNYAKIVSIVSWSAAKWIDTLPCPLLWSCPLDNGVVAWKIGHPLSANSTNILSAIWSKIPCRLSSLIEYHFFSEPGPMNDHCP